MPSIDYAMAYDFIDPTDPTTPYRLEFRYPHQPSHPYQPGQNSSFLGNPTGQLVASKKGGHPKHERFMPLSRDHVHFNDVETAVGGDNWPHVQGGIDLAEIRRRIQAAGLG